MTARTLLVRAFNFTLQLTKPFCGYLLHDMSETSYVPNMTRIADDHPYNFVGLANDFADAAKTLNAAAPGRFSWPVFSTACQALELYLKAYLRAKGWDVERLKKEIRHDIARALEEAKKENLYLVADVTPLDEEVVKIISEPHFRRDFQYRASGDFKLVSPESLLDLLDKIDQPILNLCASARLK